MRDIEQRETNLKLQAEESKREMEWKAKLSKEANQDKQEFNKAQAEEILNKRKEE